MREFYYRFIGSGNAYGPLHANSTKAVRERIKELWGEDFKAAGERMRFEVWETTPAERRVVAESNRRGYHPMYAAE